jgi:S1-C subfamily serine protease
MPMDGTGSAFAIRDLDGNRRLLTNAHVVADYTRIMVRRHASPDKFAAMCVAIGHECDLALLDIPDPEFWRDVEPLEFGPVPHLRDLVTVVGFPGGQDNISVTAGVVSRVDTVQYVHAACSLLAVQIDASINPGNSGGPAFDADGNIAGKAGRATRMRRGWSERPTRAADPSLPCSTMSRTSPSATDPAPIPIRRRARRLVRFCSLLRVSGAGVAFQNVPDAQSVGYLIPLPVVHHFLRDFQTHGRHVGFCRLGIRIQTLENPSLREHLLLSAAQSGVVVNYVQPLCAAAGQLEKRDVVLAVDDIPIANDGTIEWRAGERIFFDYLISSKAVGEAIRISILRCTRATAIARAIARTRCGGRVRRCAQAGRPPCHAPRRCARSRRDAR